MEWSFRKLICKQLTDQLKPFYGLNMPNEGWIKTLRKALGMSTAQLANRCGVSTTRILRIEKDEVLQHITLNTLEKVANKLNCRLVYALVPEGDLATIIETQTEKYILNKIKNVSHSMELEDQKVQKVMQFEQLKILQEEVIRNTIKDIWK